MITLMDSDMGRILARLKKLGLDENTLVIFTSDNGPHKEGGADAHFFNSNGPLRGIKRDLYEGGIRVPMIARWPGTIKPNSVNSHISAFWDFLPTAAEIARVRPPENIDGISYLPTLQGRNQKTHHYLYWEFYRRSGLQAVRSGRWKAVRLNLKKGHDSTVELYDLQTDLGEKHNVASQNPEIVAQMLKIMTTARTPSKHFPLYRLK